MDAINHINELLRNAKAAKAQLGVTDTAKKNEALLAIAASLECRSSYIIKANQKDLLEAKHNGLNTAMTDRLTVSEKTIAGMADGLKQVASLPDPVGSITPLQSRPSGLKIGQMRVPIGIIGIIYESRPNVTADAAALCLKAGNTAILRGGSEAYHSNQEIGNCIRIGLSQAKLPDFSIQVVKTQDRRAVGALLSHQDGLDLIIPRGGKELVRRVSKESRVPVLKHLDGVCHVYVDKNADIEKALLIADNAKTQRFGTCNTMETLLVNKDKAEQLLPKLHQILLGKHVEIRGDSKTCDLIPSAKKASERDWSEEYLGPVLAVRVVESLEEAILHINKYGSKHTDAIVTESTSAASKFLRQVDSSSVMVNASTRFADGFEYGLGAEIGISTDKLHARGPVGLEGLTSLKWVVYGDGHIRH